jgi:hypothetical protein
MATRKQKARKQARRRNAQFQSIERRRRQGSLAERIDIAAKGSKSDVQVLAAEQGVQFTSKTTKQQLLDELRGKVATV